MTTTSTSSPDFKITLMDGLLYLDPNDKLMLSSQEYFQALFISGFRESEDNHANFEEIKLKDFKYFLAYVALKTNNDATKYLKPTQQLRFTRFFENPFLFVDVKIASRLYPTAHRFNVDVSTLCNPSFKYYIQNLGRVTEDDISTLKELANINIGLQSTILTKIPDQRIADFLEVLDLGTKEIDNKVAPYTIDNPTKSTELRHLSLNPSEKSEWITKLDRLKLETLYTFENNQPLTFLTSQTALTSLELCMDIYTQSFDPQLSILTRLRSLNIRHCQHITSLASCVLLNSLQVIELSRYNSPFQGKPSLELSNFDTGPLSQLTALHTLKFRLCEIKQLNVHDLPHLTTLELNDLPLTGLNMLNLPSLDSLVLISFYALQQIQLPALPSLRKIKAVSCYKNELLRDFGNAPNLEIISLSDCLNLGGLEDSLSILSRLTQLSVVGRNAYSLDRLPASLTSLEIPAWFSTASLSRLTNLHTLKTTLHHVEGSTEAILRLTSLTALELIAIRPEHLLTSLESLQLKSLKLRSEDMNVPPLLPATLKDLYLESIQFQNLQSLSHLTSLESLNLENCERLTNLNSIEKLPLKSLILNCVAITSLESTPTSLTTLELKECHTLTSLEPLSHLTKLVSIRYRNNKQLISLGNPSFRHIITKF